MKKNYTFLLVGMMALGGYTVKADNYTDITEYYLINSGFDANFNYDKSYSGNVSGNIINEVYGWDKDMTSTYTVAGTFEYGANATFNSSKTIPATGYKGSEGGAIAFTTGWGQILNYSQQVSLMKGTYKIISSYYNLGTATAGNSNLGWVPNSGTTVKSAVNSFPVNDWIGDTITFTVNSATNGKIQIGFASSNVSSENNAKVIVDYVKVLFQGDVDKSNLVTLIASAEKTYGDGSGNTAAELLSIINSAKSINENEEADILAVLGAVKSLEDGIYNYNMNNASNDNPLDMTSLILNPSFESGFDNWTNEGFSRQSNNYFTLKNGTYYIEKWTDRGNKVGSASIYQTISGLEKGKYRLTAASGNIQQTSSNSNNNSGAAQTGAVLFADSYSVAVDTFQNRNLDFFVTGDEITIGYRAVDATGNWLVCDNFKLSYLGNNISEYANMLQSKVEELTAISTLKMHSSEKQKIDEALAAASTALGVSEYNLDDLDAAMKLVISAIENAEVSISAYAKLATAIEKARVLYAEGEGNDADILLNNIESAQNVYNNDLSEISELSEAIVMLEKAELSYRISNGSGTKPVVTTNKNFVRGATKAYGRLTTTGLNSSNILESGFCWSTESNPTVLDNKSSRYFSNNGNIYVIEELQPSTVYYARAYTISKNYVVGYGDEIKIITTPKGTITYSFDNSVMDADGHRERIVSAITEAVDYWNNLTSIKGHHLSVSYNAGTPTAEASYGGYLRFGPGTSYQRTGTAMHEMGHTIGVGQHWMWNGGGSPLRETGSSGKWLGERANKVAQFFDNNTTTSMTGDGTHMWPYGINGAQEDAGTEALYTANSLIHQALGEDGLPPTSNPGFVTPAYTFASDNNVKYYIKNENSARGLYTSYLSENAAGNIAGRAITKDEALANDSMAWYINYNPVNCYYTIQNVATGKYFSYSGSGVNGFKLLDKNPVSTEHFQLINSRINTEITTGTNTYTTKAYWITYANSGSGFTRPTLVGRANNSIIVQDFDFANTSVSQRWVILTAEGVVEFDNANPIVNSIYEVSDSKNNIEIVTSKGGITISSPIETPVTIFSITGETVTTLYVTSTPTFVSLSNGFYVIENQKVFVK